MEVEPHASWPDRIAEGAGAGSRCVHSFQGNHRPPGDSVTRGANEAEAILSVFIKIWLVNRERRDIEPKRETKSHVRGAFTSAV